MGWHGKDIQVSSNTVGSKGAEKTPQAHVRALIIAAIVVHLQMLTITFSVKLTQSIPTLLMVQWLHQWVFPKLRHLLGVGQVCMGLCFKMGFQNDTT